MGPIEAEGFPDPGTPAARLHGCICPVSNPNQGTEDNPIIMYIDCPLHGWKAYEEHLTRIRQMDRGDTTQGLGNPGENVDSYFHPLPVSLSPVQNF